MRNAGSIGGGVFLFVVGAIISFAFEFDISGLDVNLIGYIMMGAGAILFLIGLISSMSTRKSVREEVTRDPKTGSEVRETEVE